MIGAHNSGQRSEWRFPKTKHCPIRACNQKFQTRYIAKVHFQRDHAPFAVLCAECQMPVSKAHYQDHRDKYHGAAGDSSDGSDTASIGNGADNSGDDNADDNADDNVDDNADDNADDTADYNGDHDVVQFVDSSEPGPSPKKAKPSGIQIIECSISSWRNPKQETVPYDEPPVAHSSTAAAPVSTPVLL